MAELRYTRKATEDLAFIWNYTADVWSEEQADKYYAMLIASCRRVAAHPTLLGKKYLEIADDLFGFKAGRHIIFYNIVANGDVKVIRILHERMDLKNRIKA